MGQRDPRVIQRPLNVGVLDPTLQKCVQPTDYGMIRVVLVAFKTQHMADRLHLAGKPLVMCRGHGR